MTLIIYLEGQGHIFCDGCFCWCTFQNQGWNVLNLIYRTQTRKTKTSPKFYKALKQDNNDIHVSCYCDMFIIMLNFIFLVNVRP